MGSNILASMKHWVAIGGATGVIAAADGVRRACWSWFCNCSADAAASGSLRSVPVNTKCKISKSQIFCYFTIIVFKTLRTFRQLGHELKSPCDSKVDSSPVHLVRIKESLWVCVVRRFRLIRHVADLHGTTGDFKTVQLLQRSLGIFSLVELSNEIIYINLSDN